MGVLIIKDFALLTVKVINGQYLVQSSEQLTGKTMELTKIPGPMRIIWASIGSWWLANIINPGFHAIAIMMLFLIPVLIVELYFSFPQKQTQPATPDSRAQLPEPELQPESETDPSETENSE